AALSSARSVRHRPGFDLAGETTRGAAAYLVGEGAMMLPPLRVLYLLPAEGFGGAERQGVQHLAELPRHGVQITSFVGSSAALARELSVAGVSSRCLPSFPPSPSSGGDGRGGTSPLKWLVACM